MFRNDGFGSKLVKIADARVNSYEEIINLRFNVKYSYGNNSDKYKQAKRLVFIYDMYIEL